VVESTLAQYAQLIVQGFGDEDISAIYRLKAALFPAEPAAAASDSGAGPGTSTT
jgi:hypothetical protein